MGQVYIMSQQTVSINTEYFVFEEDKLFGTQFCLNGIMQQVTLTGIEAWADTSIDDLVSSLRNENTPVEYLILSSRKKASLVEHVLTDTDFDIQKTEN